MNHRYLLPIFFVLVSLFLSACGERGSSQQPTPRRGFITATPIPASATPAPTATAEPSETAKTDEATAAPDAPAPSVPPTATATATLTPSPLPTATAVPPTPRPVVIVPPTPMVIDVDVSALLAADASGAQKDPAAFALSYLPDQRALRAVAKFGNLPAGTRVKAAWTAVDLAGALPPNSKLGETQFVSGQAPNLDFAIPTSLGAFLPGKYKVEIWLNDRLDTVLNFSASAPPDVYVTALEVQPSSPLRGQQVSFSATFLNTTGGARSYDWLVLIFRPGQSKSFGESAHQAIDVPPGRSQASLPPSWKLTGSGDCESFIAQAYFRDADKNRFPFNSIGGKTVSVNFSVCPR